MVLVLVRAAPGQVLIAEGEVGRWMMLILSGTVDVTKVGVHKPDDGPAVEEVSRLAVIRRGSTIGEMSMLDGDPRYATCTAITEVEAGLLTTATSRRSGPSCWSRSRSCWCRSCATPATWW